MELIVLRPNTSGWSAWPIGLWLGVVAPPVL